jgi:DNA-binding XRE family transcriptional regulator
LSATKVNAFGAKVEEYRERLGMLQMELARKVRLSKSHLNRIEKGTRKRPKVETVLRMIEALRLTRGEAKELCDLAELSPLVLENISFEEDRQAIESEPQVSDTSIPSIAHPVIDTQNVLLGTTGKEIERLLGSACLPEDEEKQIAVEVIEFTKRLLALNEALRALRKSEESRQ